MSNNITINLENISEENMKKLKAVLEDIEQNNCEWEPECDFEQGEDCYNIAGWGEILQERFYKNEDTDNYFALNNLFHTREEAELEVKKRKILAKLERYSKWCWEQFGMSEKEAWKVSSANKCYIYYDYGTGKFFMEDTVNFKEMCNIYFPTIENAKKAIEIIGEENLKKYAFGVEV